MRLMDCVPALLAAGVMLYLLWRLFRAQAALRREREENRRLRGVLEESARVAQADSDRLRQLRHDLRHYLLLAESGAAGQGEAEALRTALEQAPAKLQAFIYSLIRTIVSLQRDFRSSGFTQ